MATAPIYCTHKELKRVFPQMNEFDGKKQIYGWVKYFDSIGAGGADDDFDYYSSANTGLVSQLYVDGMEVIALSPSSVGLVNDAEFLQSEEVFTIDAGHGLAQGDVIKINDEYMYVQSVSTNDITVYRGFYNTTAVNHADNSTVYMIQDNSTLHDGRTTTTTETSPYYYYYDSDLDFTLLMVDAGSGGDQNNPNDLLIEAGEDFTTLVTQYRTDASRYLDSRLDPNLPREQLKDKSGNFDYMIIRTTALIAASFMIKTNDPTSEISTAFMEEANSNIDAMNNGDAALSWQNTSDGSKGIIRDVGTISGTVRPVDTRGRWSGTYDLIKVKIDTTGGAIGTATYSVWVKDGDKLGMNEGSQVVTTEIINGDYQTLSGGLQIRFAGTDFDSTASVDDTWEIEVSGFAEEVDSSSLKPIRMTRRWQ